MITIADSLARGTLDELSFYFAPPAVLSTALKLGVFEVIGETVKNAHDLASATRCSPRGMTMLLNCLAAIDLLEKENGMYRLTDLSRKYLLSSGKSYLGALFICSDRLLKLWLKLPEAVASGRPPLSLLAKKERERLNLDIVEALFHVHQAAAWKLPGLIEKAFSFGKEPTKILDVAAGSAVWSLPFALARPRVKVTAVDFPPVLEVAKKFARKFKVRDRYGYIAGDIRKMDFGSEKYDLALLGKICISEGAVWTRRIIENCFGALSKNGRLLIIDYIADEERRSGLMPLLLALNALLGTEEGDTFTFSEYRQWLSNAGFTEVRAMPLDGQSPIILALKA
jgi:2-polyprenyl-3-methyl-5-hydroxy-6-metoxy-1,4-benzoquinol methylase